MSDWTPSSDFLDWDRRYNKEFIRLVLLKKQERERSPLLRPWWETLPDDYSKIK